jgi:uncharacterized protein YdeI (YjbR/CyaY-like superfamily)
MATTELAILPFKNTQAFATWLAKNHATSPGIWMQIYKKGSGTATITYAEALDEALCWGWIDSQKRSLDATAYLQRFGPRRPKSIWSKVNQTHIARLTQEGRMQPRGVEQVKSAKADGRWERAYDSPKDMSMPRDFLAALSRHKKAAIFFKTLNKTNTYAIAWRLHTAKKPETRARRMEAIILMLEKGETLH